MENLFDSHIWLKIAFSLICGFLVGIERQVRGKPVGIRTSILICLGTSFFIHLAGQVNEGKDVVRVLGQVVTGVGFLGAGVIMTKEGLVSGVTSAAEIWLLAGVGASIGLELYAESLTICLVALGVLVGVQKLEKIYKQLQRGVHRHRIEP